MQETIRVAEQSVVDSERLKEVIEAIVHKIQEIGEVTPVIARSIEETSASSDHLSHVTRDLQKKLGEFRT